MPFQPFSLRYADIAALDKLGLRLSGLRQTGQLMRGSRIEAPTSILSIVAPDAFLDVGAFCNLSGGHDQQRALRALLLGGERRRRRRARASDRLAHHLARRLLPGGERLGRARRRGDLANVHARLRPFAGSLPEHHDRSRRLDRPGRLHQGRRQHRRRARSSAPAPRAARRAALRDRGRHARPRAAAALPRGDGRAAPRRSNGGATRSTTCSTRRWIRSTRRST